MASTLTAATLTVTVSEQINLNGQPIDSKNVLTIASIAAVDKRIVTIPFTSEVTVVDFASAVAAGTFVNSSLRYLRVTNKDTVNYARIRIKKTSGQTFDTQLDAGKSFMMGNVNESVSATAAAFTDFTTFNTMSAQAYTAAVDLEIFVASVLKKIKCHISLKHTAYIQSPA